MDKSRGDRIEKRVELSASVDRVWRALTDHTEFGDWFRVNLEGSFVPGKTTKGRVTYPGYEHLVMEVGVVNMEPQRLFSFRWHPAAVDPNVDYSKEPRTLVEFKLEPMDNGAALLLTESGFDAIPPARRAEAYRMNEGGWTEQMKNIETHVTKGV